MQFAERGAPDKLQWGSGSSAGETSRTLLHLLVGRCASMGLRLFSRRNAQSESGNDHKGARFNGAPALQPEKLR